MRQADAPIPVAMLGQRYLERYGKQLPMDALLGEAVSEAGGSRGVRRGGGLSSAVSGGAGVGASKGKVLDGSVDMTSGPVIAPMSQQALAKLRGVFKGTVVSVSR